MSEADNDFPRSATAPAVQDQPTSPLPRKTKSDLQRKVKGRPVNEEERRESTILLEDEGDDAAQDEDKLPTTSAAARVIRDNMDQEDMATGELSYPVQHPRRRQLPWTRIFAALAVSCVVVLGLCLLVVHFNIDDKDDPSQYWQKVTCKIIVGGEVKEQCRITDCFERVSPYDPYDEDCRHYGYEGYQVWWDVKVGVLVDEGRFSQYPGDSGLATLHGDCFDERRKGAADRELNDLKVGDVTPCWYNWLTGDAQTLKPRTTIPSQTPEKLHAAEPILLGMMGMCCVMLCLVGASVWMISQSGRTAGQQ